MKPYLALLTAAIAMPAFAQPLAPTDYVTNAGASDLYERQSSQLVLQTTRDPKIRDFARMMVSHHAKSTADVKTAAKRSEVRAPSPKLKPDQAQMIAQLRAERGPARDAAYVSQQKTAHDQALALHQSYASGGADPALKEAAAGIVPVVSQHIEMLKTM